MDKEVKRIYDAELNRQSQTIELIASENFASQAVKKLCGSEFTNKYAEGYPGKRYYNGCEYMDQIEQLAIDELKRMWRLADAVLRNGNVYYICNGIIDAEFDEIK